MDDDRAGGFSPMTKRKPPDGFMEKNTWKNCAFLEMFPLIHWLLDESASRRWYPTSWGFVTIRPIQMALFWGFGRWYRCFFYTNRNLQWNKLIVCCFACHSRQVFRWGLTLKPQKHYYDRWFLIWMLHDLHQDKKSKLQNSDEGGIDNEDLGRKE